MKNKQEFINIILCLLVIVFTYFFIVFIIKKRSSSDLESILMGMYLFGYPLFTFITSIVMQLLIKKKRIVLSIIFIGYLIPTVTSLAYFNSSCLAYCFIYTFIALIGTFIADLIIKHKKRQTV